MHDFSELLPMDENSKHIQQGKGFTLGGCGKHSSCQHQVPSRDIMPELEPDRFFAGSKFDFLIQKIFAILRPYFLWVLFILHVMEDQVLVHQLNFPLKELSTMPFLCQSRKKVLNRPV